MKIRIVICLLACFFIAFSFSGCDQGAAEGSLGTTGNGRTRTGQTEAGGDNKTDSRNLPDTYQPVFVEEVIQNVITNRMGKNLELIESRLADIERHHFASAGIEVYIPKGLELSDRFTGFISEEFGASLVVLTNPFSMKETTSKIVGDAVRSEKVSIIFTKDIEVDGRDGKLYLTKEKYGETVVCKCMITFGDNDFSWIITATLTSEMEDRFGEELLLALKSVRVSEKPRLPPGADVNFRLTPNNLVITDGFIDKVVFTETGEFPVDKVDEPIFQAARAIIALDVDDKKALAYTLISPSPSFTHGPPSSIKEVKIDGLNGYEFVAVGRDTLSKEPLWIYSLTLFDGTDGYLMHGWVSSDRTEDFISEFRSLAKSFKRK